MARAGCACAGSLFEAKNHMGEEVGSYTHVCMWRDTIPACAIPDISVVWSPSAREPLESHQVLYDGIWYLVRV